MPTMSISFILLSYLVFFNLVAMDQEASAGTKLSGTIIHEFEPTDFLTKYVSLALGSTLEQLLAELQERHIPIVEELPPDLIVVSSQQIILLVNGVMIEPQVFTFDVQ